MSKTVKWASVLVLSVILTACQSQKVEQEGVEKSVTVQQKDGYKDEDSLRQNEEKEHKHTHVEESGHSHDHVDEDGHNHNDGKKDEHAHDQAERMQQIYAGYFDDHDIQNRELTDWAGDWQSVYPYLLDGTLDEVFLHKAKHNQSKTAEEYKAYYEIGYKTTVDRIVIEGNHVSFYEGKQVKTGKYVSDGYEVLTYEKGNRGVRYIFKLDEQKEGVPTYIQFSDHSIYPTMAGHYHLYWGDDRAKLLEELVNWPTYYPSSMDGHTIAHEMMAH